eukprot:6486315-Amphidinium_carterae.1
MNIKLPAPTQFDGKNPQFNEWAGEVKAYVTTHNVDVELKLSADSSVATETIVGLKTWRGRKAPDSH